MTIGITIADFLFARITEDEDALPWMGDSIELIGGQFVDYRQRVSAECEVKRDLLREHVGYGGTCGTCGVRKPDEGEPWPCRTLRLLGFPYAYHPDYREEWRP